MAATTSKNQPQILVLTPGKKQQQPTQFSFDDTSLTHKDVSRSTFVYHTTTLSRVFTDTHPLCSPGVHVPLSHVLSVDVSDSVVDAHVLENTRSGLKLVKLSGSFQGDNAEASSAANVWAQSAMSAAYSGASRVTHTAYHKQTALQGVKSQRRFLILVNPHSGPVSHSLVPALPCSYR